MRAISIVDDVCDALSAARGITDACIQAALRLVEEAGRNVACRRGCSACCEYFVSATLAEAVPIALWLSDAERRQRRDEFWNQIERRRVRVGTEVGVIEKLSGRAGGWPTEGPDLDRFRAAVAAYHRRRLQCPFNAGDGSCEIYPLRPLACRVIYVVDSAEYCRYEAPREPIRVHHQGLKQAVALAHNIVSSASSQAGHPGGRALPEAVARALAWLERETPENRRSGTWRTRSSFSRATARPSKLRWCSE